MYSLYGCVDMWVPWGIWLSLNPLFLFYQVILNSWPSNYPNLPYEVSTGHGYWTSHVVFTKFTLIIPFLSMYCLISNHPVTGSIIVTNFNIRVSFPLLHILDGPMRSTDNLFRGVFSDSLAGDLSCFYWPFLMFTSVTSRDFPLDGFSMTWPVQVLKNHLLCLIQSWMKEIYVVPFHYVLLYFLWDYYFTVVRSNLYSIPAPQKGPFSIFCTFKFFQ